MSLDLKQFPILYVDSNLQRIERLAQNLGSEMNLLTASSSDDGVKLLNSHLQGIAVALIDQELTGQSGSQFLATVRKLNPYIVRILSVSNCDVATALEAVNIGAVDQLIPHPWDADKIRQLLIQAIRQNIASRQREMLYRQPFERARDYLFTDRVKSMTHLATGLAKHLHQSVATISSFLQTLHDDASQKVDCKTAGNSLEQPTQRQVAQSTAVKLLKLLNRVKEATAEPNYAFTDEVDLEQLLRDAAEAVQTLGHGMSGIDVAMDIATELPMFKVDRKLLTLMLTILIERTSANCPPDSRLMINASDKIDINGTSGLRILITGEGPGWTDDTVQEMFNLFTTNNRDVDDLPELNLICAFVIAQIHSGAMSVHLTAPDGPGFEVRIPFTPEVARRDNLSSKFLENMLFEFDLNKVYRLI